MRKVFFEKGLTIFGSCWELGVASIGGFWKRLIIENLCFSISAMSVDEFVVEFFCSTLFFKYLEILFLVSSFFFPREVGGFERLTEAGECGKDDYPPNPAFCSLEL